MDKPFALSRPVGREFPISQRFMEHPESYRSTKGHTGIDFHAPEGTPVLAAADGNVIEAGLHKRSQEDPAKGYGWYVRILHEGKWNTLYTQLSPQRLTVQPGAQVRQGDLIGYSGNSGQRSSTTAIPRVWITSRKSCSSRTASARSKRLGCKPSCKPR